MEISQMICLGILVIISVIDTKWRKIPVCILAGMIIGALAYQCFWCKGDIVLIVGGIAVGGVFLIVSRITKEGMGYGDSLGILGLGIYLGLWKLLEILAGAFFLLALSGIFVLAAKRMSRKCALPFYPFLTAAYMVWVIGEAGL